MAEGQKLYRVVQSNPPTRDDFVPKEPRSVPKNLEKARLFRGLSTYETEAQARRRAKASPYLGAWIAEIAVTEDVLVHYERTTSSDGHYTLWGDPEVILRLVTIVVAV